MAKRTWKEPEDKPIPPDMAAAAGGHPLVAKILAQRGFTSPLAVQAFFNPASYEPSPARDLPGIEAAADRLERALRDKEPVCVWGDFDVDGQTSTTLLVAALRQLGAQVTYHIPRREIESHGVHLATLKPILDQGVRLLLTCDTGITANEEVAYAGRMGVDVIITDHHDLPKVLPQACSVVNPKLLPATHPLANLPGVGVAYKLTEEMYRRAGLSELAETGLDLAALGIVADLAILRDDTRYLLQRGLPILRSTPRLGLKLMMEMAELDPAWLSEEHISFVLAPRLNALGRLADANSAVEFLTTHDPGRARLLAVELEGLNQQRKLLTDQVFQAAEAQIEREPGLLNYAALVLSHPAWPAGVIGIVASRLVEHYNRPVILFSAPPGKLARGSARSVDNINISAAISDVADMLVTFGGHPMAAGLSLLSESIPRFRSAISEAIQQRSGAFPAQSLLQIDGILPLGELSLALVDDLERLAPFGPGNPALTLCSPGMLLTDIALVGRNEEHLQMVIEDRQGNAYRVIYWQGGVMQTELRQELQKGRLDLAYHARASDYFGQRKVQVEFVDARQIEILPYEIKTPRRPLEVIDCRNEPHALWLLRQAVTDRSALVWAEAEAVRKLASQGVAASDRNNLARAGCLVIWTSPPGRRELQAALDLVHPTSLYLFGQDPETCSPLGFLNRLAGLLKYAINSNNGKVSLPALAAATAQRSSVVLKGLDWLEARRNIQVLSIEGDEVTLNPDAPMVKQNQGTASQQNIQTAELLINEVKSLLAESAAFRAYFARANKDDLINPGREES
jgi:single-stranded-DNA-specific exonuclease